MKEVVDDGDNLLRRVIFTSPYHVKPDQTVSSFAFTPRKFNGIPESLSVEIERLTTYEESIVDRFRYRLYALTAGQVRQIGLDCEHDPLPGNYAHALITGVVSKPRAKQLAAGARRIHYPD